MKPEFQVIPARPYHVGQIIRRLRMEHAQAFALVGLNAHRELRRTFMASGICRAGTLNGELAALWGVTGPLMAPHGFIWMVITNELAKHKALVARFTKAQIDEFMQTKVELTTTVLPEDKAAVRFAAWLGFHVAHDGGDGERAYSKQQRQRLIRCIENEPSVRIRAGNSYAIPLGFHADEPGRLLSVS